MKDKKKQLFDYSIGNPPYQSDTRGNSNTALPVYNLFMTEAYKVSRTTELITPARFLFDAGSTPKEWNQTMLNDSHLKVLRYYQDASGIFANTDIKGGVAITYHDNEKEFGAIKTFTVFPELNEILKKIRPSVEKDGSFSSLGFVASKFNTLNLFSDFPQYDGHERRMSSNVLTFDCFHPEHENDDIAIYGVVKGKRITKYINKKYVDISDTTISKYKIIIPKADGNGAFGSTITNPMLLSPNTGFTHTFLGVGSVSTESEAKAIFKYIKSKFARALLSILKITQDMNADKWRYVPLQDFTSASDIDWSKSIHEIDLQLYRKYGLTAEEINFIETNVKEMA